jgi:hypothetical protein
MVWHAGREVEDSGIPHPAEDVTVITAEPDVELVDGVGTMSSTRSTSQPPHRQHASRVRRRRPRGHAAATVLAAYAGDAAARSSRPVVR